MSAPDEALVPITVWLTGEVYRTWAKAATEAGAHNVGDLLAKAASRSVERKTIHVRGPRRSTPRRMTPAMAEEARQMRAAGYTVVDIAARFGVSVGTIYNHLSAKGA